MRSSLHGVDHEFVSTIEDQYDRLQQSAASVEPESKLPGRAVVIEVLDPGRPCCSLDRVVGIDSVFERRGVNSHAEASASRITGALSPVMALSLTEAMPRTASPSVGTMSPAAT